MSAKFPRIAHLPWSPGATSDDKRMEGIDQFLGRDVLLLEKMDGANVCLTTQNVYARSHSAPAKGRMFDRLKGVHAQVAPLIPAHLSVFCEWCMYVHMIEYDFSRRDGWGLPLFVIGVRDDQTGAWLGWSEVKKRAENLGLDTVPFLTAARPESEGSLRQLVEEVAGRPSSFGKTREGVVVRVPEPVADGRFGTFTAKYVNEGFEAGVELTGGLREQQISDRLRE